MSIATKLARMVIYLDRPQSREWGYLVQSKRQFIKICYNNKIFKLIKTFMVSSHFKDFFTLQSSLTFVPQKDSYYAHDDTDASFLFLVKKDFFITHELIFAFFVFSFFRKILVPLMCFFLKLFFVFLNNSCLSFLYIEKKN